MKKFEKFLFFYSITAITVFFVSFGIFSPKPLNLISVVLMTPLIFYFWIKLTGPENSTPTTWSIRFLASLIILSALGVFGFFLSKQAASELPAVDGQLSEQQSENERLKTELTELKQQANVKPTSSPDISVTDLVTETPGPESSRITARSGVESIDVYQAPLSTSAKIGSLESGINYPFITKQDNWYKVVLTSTKTGWVSTDQVQEIN
jgi:hypothetical protein